MKNNQLAGMLLGLLFLSTLACAALTLKYNSSIRKMQELQPALSGRNLIQALLAESVEYGKTHPDINGVLQPFIGGKPQSNAPAAAAPAKPKK
jgi:hypothetical protein